MLSNMKFRRSSYHRCYYHILIFVISHLWSGIDSESIPGYSINASQYVTVQRGLCVHIPCWFTVPKANTLTTYAKGLWINTNGVIVSSKIHNQLRSNGRFSLVGDVWRGDCSLYIEDPLYEDEGRYRFRVEDNIKFNYQDNRPYVEVTDLIAKPEISPIKSWLDGEEVTLTCTAPGRCKRINPRITWEGNIQNGRVENWVTNHGNGTKTHSSTITFTTWKEQNNSTLSCIVRLREGLTTAQQITINIGYPPRAPEFKCSMINKEANILSTSNCTMYANNTIYILEGSQLSLTCSADSVPKSSLVWKSSHQTQNSSFIDKLSFTNMSLTDEGFYTCQATNAHGTKETSVTLVVTYPPRALEFKCSMINKEANILCTSNCTMDANNTIYIPEGSQLSLTCSADSVPKSSLVWKSSNQTQNSSSIDKLSFTNMSLTDEGFYTCQATNAHGTKETSVTFRVTYSPRKIDGRISMCWKVENRIECTCFIQSFPKPTVIWKINGKSVNNVTHTEVNISTVASNSVANSTLSIPVNVEESRNIQCVAFNIHGELVQELFNETVHSTPKAFPAAAMYGGCLAAVLILIGILLILFCKKRKMMQKKEILRQSQVSVADPIYSNSEMYSNSPHEVGPIPQKDNQSPPEIETVHLNFQDVQYMSVDFSKLKPKVATEEEEIEYAVVKRTN